MITLLAIFIGSGALSYSWYSGIELTYDKLGSFQLSFEADETGERYTINDRDVMATVKEIAYMPVSTKHPSWDCRRECRNLLANGPQDCEFDAVLADEVLQITAFGEVRYG